MKHIAVYHQGKSRFKILSLVALMILTGCQSRKTVIFPGPSWIRSTPAKQGMDPEKLSQALAYLESHSLHNGNRELVIIRNGYMIFEGLQADSVHNIWSCTKTFTSAILGMLVDEGRLNLDDPAATFEPLLQEQYAEVTFRHFATMTSGYSAEGSSRWEDMDSDDWSWTVYTPEPPLFAPGEAFAYWDEAQMMFGRVLTQVMQRTMYSYLKAHVTDPIGMGDWRWGAEGDLNSIPINNGCTSVFVNAKQLARWGWLFLNEGNWNGEQIISRDWVRKATSVQVPPDLPVANTDRKDLAGSGCYGFNWWVNGLLPDGQWKLPGAPEGCYFASGHNNNKCIVIPQWNMVIVRMGEDGHPDDPDRVYGEFLRLLGGAIRHQNS